MLNTKLCCYSIIPFPRVNHEIEWNPLSMWNFHDGTCPKPDVDIFSLTCNSFTLTLLLHPQLCLWEPSLKIIHSLRIAHPARQFLCVEEPLQRISCSIHWEEWPRLIDRHHSVIILSKPLFPPVNVDIQATRRSVTTMNARRTVNRE